MIEHPDSGPLLPWTVESVFLVRHGQSRANTGEIVSTQYGDHAVPLSEEGIRQARAVGSRLQPLLEGSTLVYRSPYLRTRQTLEHLLEGAGLTPPRAVVYEDPRLRELDHGYGTHEDYEKQQALREKHGWFYYRYQGGESPADCYDRVSGFVDSMWRQTERKSTRKVLIVSHGITIRCFVMRFLHLTVEDFDRMQNPSNADVIELRAVPKDAPAEGAVFRRGSWACFGLVVKDASHPAPG